MEISLKVSVVVLGEKTMNDITCMDEWIEQSVKMAKELGEKKCGTCGHEMNDHDIAGIHHCYICHKCPGYNWSEYDERKPVCHFCWIVIEQNKVYHTIEFPKLSFCGISCADSFRCREEQMI
jgi:hypothetical protein